MGNLGAGDVLAGELHAPLDFVGESVLEGVRVLLECLAVVGGGRPCTKSAKRDFSGRKVGPNLLYDAAERFKRSTVRVDDGEDVWVEGHPIEVFEPRYTDTFEAAIEWACEEVARFVDGERRVGVGACDGAQ